MTNADTAAESGREDRASVRIAFVMDPLPSLSLKKDSTLAMIRAAMRRGWEIYYLGQGDLLLHQGEVHGFLHPRRLLGKFSETLDPADALDPWYELGGGVLTPLAELDVIMMRCSVTGSAFNVKAYQGSTTTPAKRTESCPETLSLPHKDGFSVVGTGHHDFDTDFVVFTLTRNRPR